MAKTIKESELPSGSTNPTYRGRNRSSSGELARITLTLPSDLLFSADTHVLKKRRHAKAYNRSALIEAALRAYLKRTV